MKVKVIIPFFDRNGIHKKGEIVEVSAFEPGKMEPIAEVKEEPKKAEPKKVLKAAKKK